jgi:hypothetical protein
VSGPQETVPKPSPRGDYSNPEELIVSDLGAEALEPANPPITDLSAPTLVQVVPPRVTPHNRQIVLQEAMEENVATSSEIPHTPSMASTIGGIMPPNSPLPVRITMVSTTSTLGNCLIPSSTVTTTSFRESVTGPPFSYGMPDFDTNFVLTYSTL